MIPLDVFHRKVPNGLRTLRASGTPGRPTLPWLRLLCLFAAGFASRDLPAQVPSLRVDAASGVPRLTLRSEPGSRVHLESSHRLGGNWETAVELNLTGSEFVWTDASTRPESHRFYRAVRFPTEPPAETVRDFRLLDHTGKSRHLHYWEGDTNVVAFVLFLTAHGVASVEAEVRALQALGTKYQSQKVWFWAIDASGDLKRSRLSAEVNSLGLNQNFPVLHDRAQLVARSLNLRSASEIVAVDASTWTIFYRGPVDDLAANEISGARIPHLANALDEFLAGKKVTVSRVRPQGPAVAQRSTETIDYTTQVAPVLINKCVRCHSAGNVGPFAMNNHAAVQEWSSVIRDEVMTLHMPPWHADPEYGDWANDFSLSPAEMRTLVDWLDRGSPRGVGPDPLAEYKAPVDYPNAWPTELGEPDAILDFGEQRIPVSQVDYYPTPDPVVRTTFDSEKWVRAAVVLPSNPSAAHHQMAGLAGSINTIAGYNPGQPPWYCPPGTGRRIPKNASMSISLHYVKTPVPTTDRPRMGLYFHKEPPPLALVDETVGWAEEGPPGNQPIKPFVTEDIRSATGDAYLTDVMLYLFHPHMHLRGASMKYEAILPGNAGIRTLLSVPMFEGHWQTIYELREPIRLPKGTRIRITGSFDNSAHNHHNPAPSRTVTWGETRDHEMFLGFVHTAKLLTITRHPGNLSVPAGGTATFLPTLATPNRPVRFQWLFNGQELANATNASLTLESVTQAQAGLYAVRVADRFESQTTSNALLTITQPPAP